MKNEDSHLLREGRGEFSSKSRQNRHKRRFFEVNRDIFGNVVIFYSLLSMPMQRAKGLNSVCLSIIFEKNQAAPNQAPH